MQKPSEAQRFETGLPHLHRRMGDGRPGEDEDIQRDHDNVACPQDRHRDEHPQTNDVQDAIHVAAFSSDTQQHMCEGTHQEPQGHPKEGEKEDLRLIVVLRG